MEEIENGGILVATSSGVIKGKKYKDWKNGDFYAFLGIPFAKPPIGQLRFEPPQELEPWEGIFEATTELNKAPQCNPKNLEVLGQEDCLYLNIYVPAAKKRATLKPVAALIHGGAFREGSAHMAYYNPEFLMSEDVIVVAFNYRLGFLGNLSSDDGLLQANVGLMDQVMALKWIQKNVSYFGGNSNQVTLVGQSSGAVCAHLHMFSPMSKGLFQKIMLQSGSCYNYWSVRTGSTANILAKTLGLPIGDNKKLIEELKKLPFEKIVKAQPAGLCSPLTTIMDFNPTIGNNAFLPEHPDKLMRRGDYIKVPMLIGYSEIEGLFVHIMKQIYIEPVYVFDLKDLKTIIPGNLRITSPFLIEEYTKRVATKYNLNENLKSSDKEYVNFCSDIYFKYGVLKTVEQHVKTMNEKIYFQNFNFDTELNLYKNFGLKHVKIPGACHIDDLSYVYKTSKRYTPKPGSIEHLLLRKYLRLQTNFIKYGNPTPSHDPLLNVKWNAVTKENFSCLLLQNDKLEMIENLHDSCLQFWNDIYETFDEANSKL